MKIEDIKIEDTADANYVIKKFFNNDLKNLKMSDLEQLVLAVYNMGKDSASTSSESDETEPESPQKASAKAKPFDNNDRVKTLEDIEIGHSGEFVKADTVGTVTFIKGDTVAVLFEASGDGKMMELIVLPEKLEKIN